MTNTSLPYTLVMLLFTNKAIIISIKKYKRRIINAIVEN